MNSLCPSGPLSFNSCANETFDYLTTILALLATGVCLLVIFLIIAAVIFGALLLVGGTALTSLSSALR